MSAPALNRFVTSPFVATFDVPGVRSRILAAMPALSAPLEAAATRLIDQGEATSIATSPSGSSCSVTTTCPS